ncbi:MAG: hypothetical protein Q4A30_00610 [Candidatus Saccharibacteria bacterium]|nr:hypothetical protein [Candidatus Saccharibacteria bacterium]
MSESISTTGQSNHQSKPTFLQRLAIFWRNLLTKFAFFLDRHFAKYRTLSEEETLPTLYLPETTADLLWVLRKIPDAVLSEREREIIRAAINFDQIRVSAVMLPRAEITFVHQHDFLGPLMLDKLYRSGFSHFPVLGEKGKIVGVLHTKSLNSLEIKDTDRAQNYLDPKVYYMRDDYTLTQAFAAFLRTNCFFFLVINRSGQVTGLITYKMLVALLLGAVPHDDFTADLDPTAVAKR